MSKRMLYVAPALNTGGVGSVLRGLICGLAQAGWEVHLACYEGADPDMAASLAKSAKLHDIGTGCMLRGLRPAIIAWKLRRLVLKLKPDIINAHSFDADLLSARALKSVPVPLLVTYHTFSYMQTAGAHASDYARYAPRISGIIAVSHALEAALKNIPELSCCPLRVIWNAPDIRFFESINPQERAVMRARLGAGDGELLIGFVANFQPGKRQTLLAEAFSRLPKNTRLAFMGGTNNTAVLLETKSILSAHDALDRCVFVEHESDSQPFLQACDIYAHPSCSEAFSVALAEATACGLPIAAMRVGGNPELALEGRNALLVEADDTGGFAAALGKLAASAELRRQLGGASREIALERVHPEKHLRAYLELYERVAAGGRA